MSTDESFIKSVFHAASQLKTAGERDAYLDAACVDSPRLRRELELLLKASDLAGHFLSQPPELKSGEVGQSSEHMDQDATLAPRRAPVSFSVPTADQLPRKFGDYELLEKIAQGGMGAVYKARQSSLNRIVAIKMILAGQFAGDEEIRRFYLEAEAAAQLDHPGIVPVFDVGCHEGQHYFSMGFIDGETLAATLKKGPLNPQAAATLVRKIALAVQVAHEQGIIHRDLKPGNVILDSGQVPRVTDFGLAKKVEADSHLTTTGMVMGTPDYMPPEQAAGNLEAIGPASDVYSLGAVLYALLTGSPPFESANQIETLMKVLQEEPVAPRRHAKSIPRDLEAICLKCLEKTPSDRYSSASELADDLDRFLTGEPITAKNDWYRRLRKWTLREPVLAAHLAGIAIIMIFVFFNYMRSSHSSESYRVLLLNQGILTLWATLAIVMQKVHNATSSTHLIPVVWAAINPLLLTGALYVNEPPREILFVLYFLLIVTTGFFRRVELVIATTVSSLIGSGFLLIFEPNPGIDRSYKVLFAVTLVVTGIMLGFQVLRLKRISEESDI